MASLVLPALKAQPAQLALHPQWRVRPAQQARLVPLGQRVRQALPPLLLAPLARLAQPQQLPVLLGLLGLRVHPVRLGQPAQQARQGQQARLLRLLAPPALLEAPVLMDPLARLGQAAPMELPAPLARPDWAIQGLPAAPLIRLARALYPSRRTLLIRKLLLRLEIGSGFSIA